LSLPEIEKKQLQSLGRALLLIARSNAEIWSLVHSEFQQIGNQSLDKINTKLCSISTRFQALKRLSKPKSTDRNQASADGSNQEALIILAR